jgi:hypothetical protein
MQLLKGSNGNSFEIGAAGATLVAGLSFNGDKVVKEDFFSKHMGAVSPWAFI